MVEKVSTNMDAVHTLRTYHRTPIGVAVSSDIGQERSRLSHSPDNLLHFTRITKMVNEVCVKHTDTESGVEKFKGPGGNGETRAVAKRTAMVTILSVRRAGRT